MFRPIEFARLLTPRKVLPILGEVRGSIISAQHPTEVSKQIMALTQPPKGTLKYHERPDADLVAVAQAGDSLAMEFLLNKYKNFVRMKAGNYFLIGAGREDLIQEGMIGLYKAVRDFKADKLSSFQAFADLCVTRQIITAIKTATRQKHIPLNQYRSLNKPIYDEDSERTLLDIVASQTTSDPEELVIYQEVSEDIRECMQENLSDLESQVLISYLAGKSYQEMARDLNRHIKSIDNALQRVKRKIEKNLAEIELPSRN
jgi:RNA polymerase sporulation-specific sigma factor